MAAKARKAVRARVAAKPRAAKRTTRRAARKARVTRRAARKARVTRKPKAPKRAARKATKGAKKTARRAAKPKAPKAAKKVRKPKRVTRAMQTGSYRKVWNGTSTYTKGGLTKKDLTLNARGKVVSKKMHSRAKNNSSHITNWVAAVKQARKEMNITGFCLINRGAQGIALYKKAKALYNN